MTTALSNQGQRIFRFNNIRFGVDHEFKDHGRHTRPGLTWPLMTSNRPWRSNMLGLLAAAGLWAGCAREPVGPQWDVDVAVPLVRARLTLADLVPDSLLATDGQGRYVLRHHMRLFSLKLDTLFSAPDTSFVYRYGSPFMVPVQINPGASFPPNVSEANFDIEDLELRFLRIRSGGLDFTVENRLQGLIRATFSLPGATVGGQPVSITSLIPAATPQGPSSISSFHDLAGHAFDLRGPAYDQVNTLVTNLNYSVPPEGSTITVGPQDSIVATVRYTDLVPAYAKGYFGTRTLQVEPDTVALDLFDQLSGVLDLGSVQAALKVSNGIGVDARVQIGQLRSVNRRTQQTVALSHAITNGPINLDRAIDLGNGPLPGTNTFPITDGNSNIEAFITNLPDAIAYAMDVTISPLGDVSNGNDFFYYESELAADLELDIPLQLAAQGLALSTISAVDLPGTAEHHAIRNGTLHVFANNGFPFSLDVVVDVIDAQDQTVTSFHASAPVAAGTVGTEGTVVAPVRSQVSIPVSAAGMTALHTYGRVRIRAVLNTTNAPELVRITVQDALDLGISVEANYLINGDE